MNQRPGMTGVEIEGHRMDDRTTQQIIDVAPNTPEHQPGHLVQSPLQHPRPNLQHNRIGATPLGSRPLQHPLPTTPQHPEDGQKKKEEEDKRKTEKRKNENEKER